MSNTSKISLIGPVTPYRGGIAHFTTSLAKKFVEYGYETQVISFKKQYPAWLYPGESDRDHSPDREKVDAQYLLKPLNPFSWRKAFKAIRNFAPQQVVIQWWVTFWGPVFRYIVKRLKRFGIPVTLLIHNALPHEDRPWDKFLAKQVLKNVDRYIVMTEKEKIRVMDLLPQAKNIAVSPLPIDDSFNRTGLTKAEVREKLGVPIDAPVILFFGIIRPYKGLKVLIDAFKIVSEQKPSAHLWVVGEFWEDKNRYLSQVDDLGLAGRVLFTDRYVPDDEVASFFESADLFAAPYVDGTQSAAIRTALGFGLPVVATDAIQDGLIRNLPDRCQIIKAGDVEALAKAILAGLLKSVQDQDEVKALVENGWQTMVDAVANINLPKIIS